MAAFVPKARPSVEQCYRLPWFKEPEPEPAFETRRIQDIGAFRESSPLFMSVDSIMQKPPEEPQELSYDQQTLQQQQDSEVLTWPIKVI